jgi:hypothetical protein
LNLMCSPLRTVVSSKKVDFTRCVSPKKALEPAKRLLSVVLGIFVSEKKKEPKSRTSQTGED